MPIDQVSGDQAIDPGVVRRARKAVAASELKLLDAAGSAAGAGAPPAQPTPAEPRDGGLVHVIA